MSSPSSVFTLPQDFDHPCDNDNGAVYGPSSSSSANTKCCYSPIFSPGSSKAKKENGWSKENIAEETNMSEIMESTTRWNQANNNTTATSPLRTIFGDSTAVVFSTLSMDDDDENDHADDNDHNNRRKQEDCKKSAAAGTASCRRHRQPDGRLIMPRWLAVSLLVTLTVSVIFFTKATWWTTTTTTTTAGAGAGVRGIRRPISTTSSSNNITTTTSTATTAYQDLLLSILKTLTPRRTLLNTSTPQGQAFAWLLESVAAPVSTVDKDKDEDDSLTRMRRRMRHLLEQQEPEHSNNDDVLSSKRQQVLERYVHVTLDFALHGASSFSPRNTTTVLTPAVARANLPTCQWPGISCQSSGDNGNDQKSDNVFVTHLSWPGFNLTGQIPEEIQGLRYLLHLDFAENELTGTLPTGLFALSRLKNLYLHQNRLGGTLNVDDNNNNNSTNDASRTQAGRLQGFAQLRQLENVYLGNNFFHGPFPTGLNARGGKLLELRTYNTFPFCRLSFDGLYFFSRPSLTLYHPFFVIDTGYLSLYQNRLTGHMPEDLNWHKMVYLDLSYNQFNGTLPVDWCLKKNVTVLVEQSNNDTTISSTNTTTTTVTETRTKITTSLPNIRYLFLNSNQFSGTLPADFPNVLGNGRVELLHLGDNEFHGHVPGDYSKSRIFMTSLEVQNNHFTSMDPYICTLSVLTPPDGELVNLRADCPICTCPSLCATPCPNNTFITSSHSHRNRTKQNTQGNQKNETLPSTSVPAAAIVGGEHF
jgi:hypothetical protein